MFVDEDITITKFMAQRDTLYTDLLPAPFSLDFQLVEDDVDAGESGPVEGIQSEDRNSGGGGGGSGRGGSNGGGSSRWVGHFAWFRPKSKALSRGKNTIINICLSLI